MIHGIMISSLALNNMSSKFADFFWHLKLLAYFCILCIQVLLYVPLRTIICGTSRIIYLEMEL